MKAKSAFLATVMLLATTVAASAVPVTFDFGNTQSSNVSSLTFSSGGFTLTATAISTDGTATPNGTALVNSTNYLTPNEGGLGVHSTADTNHEIDGGVEFKDLLFLTFNQAVEVLNMTFARVDADYGGDTAYITVDGSSQGLFNLVGADHPSSLALNLKGTVFGIGALGTTDNFKLRSVTVSPVPIPPAIALLGSGILGLVALGRRRDKSKRK